MALMKALSRNRRNKNCLGYGEFSSVGFRDSPLITLGRLAQWNERGFLKQQTGVRFRPSVVRYNWAAPLWKEFSSCQPFPYMFIYIFRSIVSPVEIATLLAGSK